MRCMPKSESRVSTLLFEPRPWGKLHCFQVFLLLRCRYSQPVSNNLSHHSNTFLKVATFKCNSSSSGEIAHAFGYMLRQSGRQASFSLRHLYLLLPTHVCTGIRNFCESCHKHGACSTTRSHPALKLILSASGWTAKVIPEHRPGCNKMHPPNGSVPIFR